MITHSGPLFKRSTSSQAFVNWLGFGLNVASILGTSVWLLTHRGGISVHWSLLIGTGAVALFLADFCSGLVHWATDTWLDELSLTRVVSIAREHHLYPHHILGYGAADHLGYMCWPAVTILGPPTLLLILVKSGSTLIYLAILVCAQVSTVLIFGTYFHRFGHQHSKSPSVRALQRARLLITPEYHRRHHQGSHNSYYCAINGWANPVCDKLRVWRFFERVFQMLTGAEPRRNDKEWFARFSEDRSFMTDPVPSLLRMRGGFK